MTDYTTIEPFCSTHNVELAQVSRDRPFITAYDDGTNRIDLDWDAVECVPFVFDHDQDRDRRACQREWALDIRRETSE